MSLRDRHLNKDYFVSEKSDEMTGDEMTRDEMTGDEITRSR
jgi:hypothetical protein